MKNYLLQIIIILSFPFFYGCKTQENNDQGMAIQKNLSPLSSWNEGTAKNAIIQYVTQATDSTSSGFIPVKDRIATFDNDGTLWSEQPMYFQFFFAIDKVKAMAGDHPEWKTKQPFKALLENDMKTFSGFGEHGLIEVVMATHSGMTVEAFEKEVKDWLATAKHPTLNRPYNELVYQPMLELLEYLRENDFQTFIVSGGGIEFMRPWVEEAYGISKSQVVGSSIKTEFKLNNGKAEINRMPALDFIDDKEGKPIGINKFIGRVPVFAGGNSDGDLQMLQYCASNAYPSFNMYIHHTDSVREFAYDKTSSIGRLDKGLTEATEKGWTVVDMEKDWKVIYPFELKSN